MTSGQSSSEEITFPTDWHSINIILGTDVRQLSEDTFELRSPSHTVVINKEGFDLYRSDPRYDTDYEMSNELTPFERWLENEGIQSVPRMDLFKND